MSRKKVFLIIQSVLCVLTAVLLAAAALRLYFDGAAKQAEGDLFYYMFTRERVGEKLLPILPVLLITLGMGIAGWILGVKDEKAERPVRDGRLLRDPDSIREKAVHQQADRKTAILRTAVLAAALILILLGILNGGMEDVLAKGMVICTECIGLG